MTLATLNQELDWALNGFQRWMNRPLARIHVYTWRLANQIEQDCPCIRLLRAYRDELSFGIGVMLGILSGVKH